MEKHSNSSLVLPVLAAVLVLSIGINVSQVITEKNLDNTLKQLPPTAELMARFKLSDKTSLVQSSSADVLWTDNEGYTYNIPAQTSFKIVKQIPQASLVPSVMMNDYFKKELDISNTLFTERKFILNEENSVINDMVATKAWQKDGELCVITIANDTSLDEPSLTTACTNQLEEVKDAQRPVIDALHLKGEGQTAKLIHQNGSFFEFSVFGQGPGGQIGILKKEQNTYRTLFLGNGIPECTLVDKEKIPSDVLSSISSGNCMTQDGK
ncbi:MAG: hypothetical protein WCW16_03965 [Candidatus Magasanikbacteria bacterium]